MKSETAAGENTIPGGKHGRKFHGVVPAVIASLTLLIGLSLLLYPSVSEYVSSLNFKREIEDFRGEVASLGGRKSEMLAEAESWNAELLRNGSRIGSLSSERRLKYNSLLNPSGTGMMGYIGIEKLRVYLPVYHGTEESALRGGVGHLEGSSLPVGGAGSHSVLSGHTGLPSAKLFGNIDRLEKGDIFTLYILGEMLTYRVESSIVLTPEEAEKQNIESDKDICTLMTCTPYGVNSHRLLVRGVRVDTPGREGSAFSEDGAIEIPVPVGIRVAFIAVLLIIAAALFAVILRRVKKRRAERR